MHLIKATLTALALLAPTTLATASGLIPLTDRDDLYGWEAVGRIDIGKSGYCTGVLIASDLVLTAAHCIYDPATGKARSPDAFTFSAGLRDGIAIERRGIQQTVAHSSYKPRAGVTLANIRHDIALLKLDSGISTFTAAPFAIHSGVKPGNDVSVVSYGKGRDTVLSWQKQCDVLGRGQGLIAFNCNVTHGSSGAPVFIKEGNRARIASLVSSGRAANGEVVAFGMDLPDNVAQLKRALRAAPASFQATAPTTIKRITVGGNRQSTGAKFIKN